MKKDKKKNTKKQPPVREGQAGNSIAGELKQENRYPRAASKDIQHKNQPEFTGPDNGEGYDKEA